MMIRVALTLVAVLVLAMIDMRPSVGQAYHSWCANYGGSSICGFSSYEQCKMTASGSNAWCVQNQ